MNDRPVPITPDMNTSYRAHMKRHRAESGLDGFHFMPFSPGDPDGPSGFDGERLERALGTPGWQRSFGYFSSGGDLIAHVHLKSDQLKTLMHRCWLELGVEAAWRRQGLGQRLCEHAIVFARDVAELDWLDLYTFAHNKPARALYRKLGFLEIGLVPDRFRIDGVSIGDIQMTLPLRGQSL